MRCAAPILPGLPVPCCVRSVFITATGTAPRRVECNLEGGATANSNHGEPRPAFVPSSGTNHLSPPVSTHLHCQWSESAFARSFVCTSASC